MAVVAAAVTGVLSWSALATALDEDAARTAVEARMDAVRACTSAAGADAHGGVTLTLTLGGGGAVRQVDLTRRGPDVPSEAARCMAGALRTLDFEAGARDTTVVVRLAVSAASAGGERVRLVGVSVSSGSGAGYGS